MLNWRQIGLGALLAFVGVALAGEPATKPQLQPVQLNIPAQEVGDALNELGRQSGLIVMMYSSLGKGIKSPAVVGRYTPAQALDRLLKDTMLSYEFVDARTVAVREAKGSVEGGKKRAPAAGQGQAPVEASGPEDTQSKTQESGTGGSAKADEAGELSQIVVTAQKRTEKLMDVPVPVTAISADTLVENNQTRLQDYFASIPGFSFSPGFLSQSALAFRGIATNTSITTATTVAVTLDDVPFSGSTSVLSSVLPDIDPSDLARLEALRGPQGTLYGASSMGGLLKYVTVDPSTDKLSGRVQADVNSVRNGSQAGYAFRGAVNLPVTDAFAVRASAFTRRDPGYIDNVLLGIAGANSSRADGGRVSALWRPSERLSLKLSAMYQDARADSNNDEQPSLGMLKQSYLSGCCGWETKLQAYSANLTAKLGIVDLTAVSGYIVDKFYTTYDYTYLLSGLAQAQFGVTGAGDLGHQTTERFTQELRASIPIGQRLEWLVGGFYEHENSPWSSNDPAVDLTTGAVAGTLGFASIPTQYNEYAAFTNLTVHLADRFDVQLGGRQSHIEQTERPGVLGGPEIGGTLEIPQIESSSNVFTYLVTPEYKFSSSLMVYARIASGYRPGAFNSFNPDPLIPRAAAPDKTQNYEIGVKSELFDRMLSVDASLYRIDWKGIQTGLIDPNNGISYTTNGSRAKSQGIELSIDTRPLAGLTVAAWVTYDDADLTEGFPANSTVYGPAGSRLPLSSRFSANVSVNQAVPLSLDVTGYVGGALSYVGERLGVFNVVPERPVYPAYAKLDLHSGVNYGSWTVNLYANNITDRRGLIGGGPGDSPPNTLRYITPRTVGLSVTKSF